MTSGSLWLTWWCSNERRVIVINAMYVAQRRFYDEEAANTIAIG
jgi:hypothetical protein